MIYNHLKKSLMIWLFRVDKTNKQGTFITKIKKNLKFKIVKIFFILVAVNLKLCVI